MKKSGTAFFISETRPMAKQVMEYRVVGIRKDGTWHMLALRLPLDDANYVHDALIANGVFLDVSVELDDPQQFATMVGVSVTGQRIILAENLRLDYAEALQNHLMSHGELCGVIIEPADASNSGDPARSGCKSLHFVERIAQSTEALPAYDKRASD